MKKVIQNYRTDKLKLIDVPMPKSTDITLFVKNVASLVSIGTDQSIIEFVKKYFRKANSSTYPS